jgi:hypothetical protein
MAVRVVVVHSITLQRLVPVVVVVAHKQVLQLEPVERVVAVLVLLRVMEQQVARIRVQAVGVAAGLAQPVSV